LCIVVDIYFGGKRERNAIMMCRLFGVLFAALVFMQSSADAALLLRFGQGGVSGLTTFTGQAGRSIEIELYVVETGGNDELSGFGLSQSAFNFQIQTGAGDVGNEVFHADPSTYVFNPGLVEAREVLVSDAGRLLGVTAGAGFNGFVADPVLPIPGERQILLGTATLNLGVLALGDYSLRISNQGFGSFGWGPDPFELDDNLEGGFFSPSAGTAILTVTAVPEPSSVAVLGMMGVAGVARAVRRRRNKVVA
jgi:hypothetical protein